jgi:primary-amine oxidase
MPVEHLRVGFRPQNFFKINPSMDVPGNQKDEKSGPAFQNGNANGHCDNC